MSPTTEVLVILVVVVPAELTEGVSMVDLYRGQRKQNEWLWCVRDPGGGLLTGGRGARIAQRLGAGGEEGKRRAGPQATILQQGSGDAQTGTQGSL